MQLTAHWCSAAVAASTQSLPHCLAAAAVELAWQQPATPTGSGTVTVTETAHHRRYRVRVRHSPHDSDSDLPTLSRSDCRHGWALLQSLAPATATETSFPLPDLDCRSE